MTQKDSLPKHGDRLADDLAVLSRRRVFGLAGVAGASVLAGCGSPAANEQMTRSAATDISSRSPVVVAKAADEVVCVSATPAESAGPYPGDGSNGPNVLIESGIVRSDIRPSFGSYTGVAQGVPTTITLNLQDLNRGCEPGVGMAVYVFHCDRVGAYSLYSAAEANYLRGIQITDQAGRVSFTSIYPACYRGRWPHIHFEVFDSLESAVAGDDARLTSQIALPQDASAAVFAHDAGYVDSADLMAQQSLSEDFIFGDGWDAELAAVSGHPAQLMSIELTVALA